MEKIKILFLHSQLVCGGAEQALFDLVNLMDKARFDITVLVQYDGGIWEQKFQDAGINVVSIWSCQKASRNPIVKLQNFYKRDRIVKAMKNDGEGLLDICFSQTFDIIVSYSIWFMQSMCFSKTAKTIKYIHGDIASNTDYRKNILKSLNLIRKFDRIICVSNMACSSFQRVTGITENVVVHFNPLNSMNVRYLAGERSIFSGEIPVICAVGRLVKEKGYDRLIRIHKRLIESGVKHELVIVGDGPEKERLDNLVAEINANDTVVLAGYQANPYPYIKHSKFLVCSSFTEGLPVIAMEALALKVPIVSSAPSVREVFGDEVCGLITEVGDESLEAGIRRMLTDQEFYLEAKAGAGRRSSYFDGKRMVQQIEDEFMRLVEECE